MKAIVSPSRFEGTVKAIASKSHAHRILICAAFADKDTLVICEETSEDINATVDCLIHLGAGIKRVENGFLVHPINFNKDNSLNDIDKDNDNEEDNVEDTINTSIDINCGESGSTLRFLLPIVCTLGKNVNIYSKGRLPQRPLSPLYEELIKHGANISKQGEVPLKTFGQITSGEYTLPANISSQYISGLLFALPMLDGDSVINLTEKIESKSYIDMTIDVLKIFNIEIKWKDNQIFIKGNQSYISPNKIIVEGDWSNVAFWLSAGALSHNYIKCTNLNINSLQGDKEVVDILKKFGADINIEKGPLVSISVKDGKKNGITIDANNIPDLVPILALVASVSNGVTQITNASRLRLKESDRIESVVNTLSKLGADIKATEDGMIIVGKDKLVGGEIDSYNDHRIAMMATIAAIVSENPVIINNASAVNKSYGGFYNDFISLGGKIILE